MLFEILFPDPLTAVVQEALGFHQVFTGAAAVSERKQM